MTGLAIWQALESLDAPQVLQPCTNCSTGYMMLHQDGKIECEHCGHQFPVLVDGTPVEHSAAITEDEDRWL